jgi:hypothetical protein
MAGGLTRLPTWLTTTRRSARTILHLLSRHCLVGRAILAGRAQPAARIFPSHQGLREQVACCFSVSPNSRLGTSPHRGSRVIEHGCLEVLGINGPNSARRPRGAARQSHHGEGSGSRAKGSVPTTRPPSTMALEAPQCADCRRGRDPCPIRSRGAHHFLKSGSPPCRHASRPRHGPARRQAPPVRSTGR